MYVKKEKKACLKTGAPHEGFKNRGSCRACKNHYEREYKRQRRQKSLMSAENTQEQESISNSIQDPTV